MNTPLVTIGIPVRNGTNGLEEALKSVLNQSYKNIEIIISENASTDDTYNICMKFKEQYGDLIRIYKQEKSLTAVDNFRFVLDKAKGNYFMWVAHDDTRELNYIEMLIDPFLTNKNDNLILTFGDLYITNGVEAEFKNFEFENVGLSIFKKFAKTAELQAYHMYGLWKTKKLQKIPFINNPYYPDKPILMCASYLGEFKHVRGVDFYYKEVIKTKEERLKYQDNLKQLPKFLFFKFLIVNFKAVYSVSNSFYATLSTLVIFTKYIKLIPKYILNKVRN